MQSLLVQDGAMKKANLLYFWIEHTQVLRGVTRSPHRTYGHTYTCIQTDGWTMLSEKNRFTLKNLIHFFVYKMFR